MGLYRIEDKELGTVYWYEDGVNITERMKKEFLEAMESSEMSNKVDNFFKKYAMPTALATGVLNIANRVFAESTESIGDKFLPLLQVLQDLALPVGVIVSSWGLIEIIMGNFPSGKEKIKYAIIGFVGMFIIPEIFYTIRDAFRT